MSMVCLLVAFYKVTAFIVLILLRTANFIIYLFHAFSLLSFSQINYFCIKLNSDHEEPACFFSDSDPFFSEYEK